MSAPGSFLCGLGCGEHFTLPAPHNASIAVVRALRFPSAKQWGEKRGAKLSVTLNEGCVPGTASGIHQSQLALPSALRDRQTSPTAAAEGESLAAKPGAILNQLCSVLFQLPLLVSPSRPSTWQGSCTASFQAGGAGPCASVPSSSPSSSPPSSPCPAPATTSTTGKVGEGLCACTGLRGGCAATEAFRAPSSSLGFIFCTPPVAILVPPAGNCVALEYKPSLGSQPGQVVDPAERLQLRN